VLSALYYWESRLTVSRGGLELLFSNQRVHKLEIPKRTASGTVPNITWLIDYLCKNKLKDPRKDLFVLDDTVYRNLLPVLEIFMS
jgi:ubiquitin related modifier 1